MNQAREKPKTLLLRKRLGSSEAAGASAPWAQLGKALKTFTEFEEIEVDEQETLNLVSHSEVNDHLFLDANLVSWISMAKQPVTNMTIAFTSHLPWHDPSVRDSKLQTLARHPFLVLDIAETSDLVRILHLFLMPKRLGGITPMMEKGSLIVGEKVMDSHSVGSMMDRLSAYLDQLDGLELKTRIPDLRQALTALIYEGLRTSASARVTYPYIDFQASASKQKLGINLRFPRGEQNFENIIEKTLSGQSLFWHQIWQCSDLFVVTYHEQHEEIEVTLALLSPMPVTASYIKTYLYKTCKRSARKENLLDPPSNFTFKVLSDIRIKNSEQIFISDSGSELSEIDFGSLPENVARKLSQLDEQCRELNDQLLKKDSLMQDALIRAQIANRELGTKRSEIIRVVRTSEVRADAADKKILELEARLDSLKKETADNSSSKQNFGQAATHDTLARLEGMLRASENEKSQLRESILHEQKRVALFEQKYSHLYKEISIKEREINDLKSTFAKMRKDQANKQLSQQASIEPEERSPDKTKEIEEREASFKQELRKLTFKLDSQEKNTKAIQNEAAEKLKMLDVKLKAAKAKEIELLKKIEELTSSLKKAAKVA